MAHTPTTSPALPRIFARYQEWIRDGLRAELAPYDSPLYTTLKYYLGWVDPEGKPVSQPQGKGLRPTLCLFACESVGGDPKQALPAAVSLECIHNFSLIHDDIQDRDTTRHHRQTVWAIWGVPVGVVSGNTIFTLADLAVQRLLQRGAPARIAVEVGTALATHYLRMMEGQFLDISFESRTAISVDEYLDMIERKTGALIQCSVYAGALIGLERADHPEVLDGIHAIGKELGYIFQIRDDILGVWGGPATGKPVGADIKRKKKALPVVHVLSEATGAASKQLSHIFSKEEPTTEDVEAVLGLMDKLGTKEYCESLAERHWRRAKDVLQSVSLAEDARESFTELGEFLLVRES